MKTLHPCAPTEHVLYETPWGITVTVNKAVRGAFGRACRLAYYRNRVRKLLGKDTWRPKRIDSYNCRTIRGSSTYSRHAYAAAWDFFSSPPGVTPPGGVWEPTDSVPEWFARSFEFFGFTWGGRWATRPDTPHIEWSPNTA